MCSAYRILTRKFSAVFCFVRTHKHNTHLPGTETCGCCNEAAESECVPSMMRIPKTFREHFNLWIFMKIACRSFLLCAECVCVCASCGHKKPTTKLPANNEADRKWVVALIKKRSNEATGNETEIMNKIKRFIDTKPSERCSTNHCGVLAFVEPRKIETHSNISLTLRWFLCAS